MNVQKEVIEFLETAIPMVDYGDITVTIRVHQGKVKKISKGIHQEALVKEEKDGEEGDK